MDKTNKPLFVLRPNLKSALLPMLLWNSFLFIVGLLFLIFISAMSAYFTLPLGVIFLLFLFVLPIIPRYLDFKRREYRFFKDKLEYADGWWVINRHVVPYAKVTDITLSKQIWNRLMGTGTIRLITAGSILGSVHLDHIQDSEKIYEHLQKEILKLN
ncbi:PH domain-containing protein [Candidatus Woesearchaeota archaeon]|nr:PH domain-containing protein [Candidatus Woesearchaeota archaeon]